MNKYYYTYIVIPTNREASMFGKIYFGKHITTNINDGYIASGRLIKDYLKKYPNDYYREIIKYYNSKEELNKAEYELIKPHLNKDYCLNLKEGGEGGNLSNETKKKLSKSCKNNPRKYWQGKHLPKEMREKISETQKGRIPWNKGIKGSNTCWCKGKQLSADIKNKLSEAHKGFKRVYDNPEHTKWHMEK